MLQYVTVREENKLKQKQETENNRNLRLVKKTKRSKEGVFVWKKTSK